MSIHAIYSRWLLVFAMACHANALARSQNQGSAVHAQSNHGNNKASTFRFEVESIKESQPRFGGSGLTADGFREVMSLEWMIKLAYGQGWPSPRADPMRVVNLPNWSDRSYQIDARVAETDLKAWQSQGRDEQLLRSALRALLEERFRLVLRTQQTKIDGYQLVLRGKGVKLKPTPPDAVLPVGRKLPDGGIARGSSQAEVTPRGSPVHYYGATMADLATDLESSSDRPVFDKTGLTGRYDFTLYRLNEHPDDPAEEVRLYQIRDIGLGLSPGKGPGIDLIIDHIEKPTPN